MNDVTRHQLYSTWAGMMSRCYNPNHKDYHTYGGQGVTVCSRWHSSSQFIADIERLIGQRPPGMTLDRVNGGNYEPGEVRWATRAEQVRNSKKYLDGRKSHPLYHIWWYITQRYPGEISDRWSDFWVFAEDVSNLLGPRPGNAAFRRIDRAEPYKPGNIRWGPPSR